MDYYCDSLICPWFSGALYGMNVHMLVEFKSLPVALETRLRQGFEATRMSQRL
jgi:hypothetical protein